MNEQNHAPRRKRRLSSTTFEAIWQAEIIRQQEAEQGPFDDRSIQQHLDAESDIDARLITRATLLTDRHKFVPVIARYQLGLRLGLWILILTAILSGVGLAMQITPTQVRTVSLIEALIMLIMLNALFIIVWLVSIVTKPRARGLAGWLFKAISNRLHKADIVRVASAHTSVMHRYRLLKPTFSSLSHLLWALLLTAALLTLTARFVAFEYEFVWRTTLLSQTQISALLNAFHAIPSLLGLPRPEIDQLSVVAHNNRQVAIWLLTCVCVYALLPRLALLLASAWMRQQRLQNFPIDWSLAGFSELQQQWQRSAVVEVEPPPMAIQRSGPNAVEQSDHHIDSTTTVNTAQLAQQLVITVDWPAQPQSYLQSHFGEYAEVSVRGANSAAERQKLLQALHQHTSTVPRTLLLVNAQLSPDRGTLRFIDSLAEYTTPHIGLVRGKDPSKESLWRDYLHEHLAELDVVTLAHSAGESFAENAAAITQQWLTKL